MDTANPAIPFSSAICRAAPDNLIRGASFSPCTISISRQLTAANPVFNAFITDSLAAGLPVFSVWMSTITPAVLVIAGYLVINYFRSASVALESAMLPPAKYFSELGVSIARGSFAIILPVVIFGGIYLGVFTATEAGAVGAVYAIILAYAFTFRKKFNGTGGFFDVVVKSAINVGAICILISTAMVAAQVLTLLRVPVLAVQYMQSISNSPYFFLVTANVLMFILGMLLETNTNILITVPIMAPIAVSYGIDPVHFAAIVLLNLEIGLITPPFAANIFVASKVIDVPMQQLLKDLAPFFVWDIVVLLLVTYVPEISTWLPLVMDN